MKAFINFLRETLSDPNDKQGSTHRVCLVLFLGTIMLLIVAVAIASNPMALPAIPDSVLNLIYYVVSVLVSGIAFAKGAAVYKAVNVPGEKNESAPEITDRPAESQP